MANDGYEYRRIVYTSPSFDSSPSVGGADEAENSTLRVNLERSYGMSRERIQSILNKFYFASPVALSVSKAKTRQVLSNNVHTTLTP